MTAPKLPPVSLPLVLALTVVVSVFSLVNAEEPPIPLTLTVTPDLPDDLDLPAPVKLHCALPEDDSDSVLRLLGLTMYEHVGERANTLASVNFFTPDCHTYRDSPHVRAYGQIDTDAGHLTVEMQVGGDQAGVDGYSCKAKYIDSMVNPSEATVRATNEKLKFFAILSEKFSEVEKRFSAEIAEVRQAVSNVAGKVASCSELRHSDHVTSPRQKVTWVDGTQVLCDTETYGGGWTIFQRRQDGNTGFNRGWKEYEYGFGNLDGSFWLGLHKLKHLMHEGPQELLIVLKVQGKDFYAHYSHFHVSDVWNNYRLRLSGYNGTAGDSLGPHHGMEFTTIDKDNDRHGENCAGIHSGGWWYDCCDWCNLNGMWRATQYHRGITWDGVGMTPGAITFVEMKTRPVY